MAYDYGVMRDCHLSHFVTDWMGDDGWLVQQASEIRKFNYIGDIARHHRRGGGQAHGGRPRPRRDRDAGDQPARRGDVPRHRHGGPPEPGARPGRAARSRRPISSARPSSGWSAIASSSAPDPMERTQSTMQDPWDQRLGVWWIAEDRPDQPAIVECPSGERLTYGELAGRAHQLVHGLRAQGLEVGDIVTYALPNGLDIVLWQLAASEGGFRSIALNPALSADEMRAIADHCGRRCGRRPRALRGPRRPSWPAHRRSGCASPSAGRSTASSTRPSCSRASPRRSPDGPGRRRHDRLLLRHDRQAQGRVAGAAQGRSGGARRHDEVVRPRLPVPALRRRAPRLRRHAPRRLPGLLPRRAARRAGPRHPRAVRRRGAARGDRAPPGHDHVHGADAVRPPPPPARGGAGQVRRVEPAGRRARGGAVPARGEAADVRLVGPGDLGDLRRHRGRGHDRQAPPVAGEARHGRPGRAGCHRARSSTTTATSCRPARSATSTCATACGSSTATTPSRPRRCTAATRSRSATSAGSTRTATCSCATGPRT